ncbi:Alcohol dehydrogenase YqhD [Tritrichomonas foetus]|uniref:Alcohol dehydrogenase YqhD n=1 Tax=Tritrichomonas foetus TaxID=1144522 RepID=A0A1J4JMA1_9EUKA|nr:Alcohol dehydrogenase YqhD [Tritrichomonas foetus]|eukprot:OHS99825.1 Alcohol dehydrogenase YqhD [Tritrichomonas foetus]
MSSLLSYHWQNSTHIAFGVGAISQLKKYIPREARVLCLYNGDHIEKSGVKSDLEKVLTDCEARYRWRGGIENNPDFSSCLEISEELRKTPADILVAVGGGSVMDATKYISGIVNLPNSIDPWSVMSKPSLIGRPIPIMSVCTLAATGSEWDPHFVISRRSTGEKISQAHNCLRFKVSVLDPRYTLSVPFHYTANGVYDTFTHVCEQYITGFFNPLQDRLSEAILSTIVEVAPKLMKDLSNLNFRATMMQCSALALNDLIGLGTGQCWGTHNIGLALTAKYNMDHAETLACIQPWLWRRFFDVKKFKLAQMAERVWGRKSGSVDELANYSILKTEEFTSMLKLSRRIGGYVKEKDQEVAAKNIADKVWEMVGRRPFGEHKMIKKEDVEVIVSAAF